jgi:hypothetical protein
MSEDNEDGPELEEHVRVRLANEDVRKMLVADSDSANFGCTDIDGAQHDLNHRGAVTISPAGPKGRFIASMPAIGPTS